MKQMGGHMDDKIFNSEFFACLTKGRNTAGVRINNGINGQRKSTAKGASVEFSDFREYIHGDDIRRIDWNAYGRSGKLFVKQFMEEKEGMFHIMLDLSRSMDYGRDKKSIMALRIAGWLAYRILNQLDRVRIGMIRDEQVWFTKGITGNQSFKKLLTVLESAEFGGAGDLGRAVLSQQYTGRGFVILISDFFEPDMLEEAIKYLKFQKQEIILIHVLAEEELNPIMEGTVCLIDSETGGELRVTAAGGIMKQYKAALNDFQNYIKETARKYQAYYLQVSAAEPIGAAALKMQGLPV